MTAAAAEDLFALLGTVQELGHVPGGLYWRCTRRRAVRGGLVRYRAASGWPWWWRDMPAVLTASGRTTLENLRRERYTPWIS